MRILAPEEPALDLDRLHVPEFEGLTRLGVDALRLLYEGGRCPPIEALSGAPQGRMLSVARLDEGLPRRVLARLARGGRFPWAGKSFAHEGEARGRGINRIRLLGRREWYPFTTRHDASVLDGQPCLLLDYDHPQNPWFIRRIRDELREVGPGLYLGPALFRLRGEHRLVLFFAIDHT